MDGNGWQLLDFGQHFALWLVRSTVGEEVDGLSPTDRHGLEESLLGVGAPFGDQSLHPLGDGLQILLRSRDQAISPGTDRRTKVKDGALLFLFQLLL